MLSSAAFGLGVSGLAGSATIAAGGLLSTATNGSFSSASALLSYNAANGYVGYRATAAAGVDIVAVLENHPATISGRLMIGA